MEIEDVARAMALDACSMPLCIEQATCLELGFDPDGPPLTISQSREGKGGQGGGEGILSAKLFGPVRGSVSLLY